MDFRTHYFPSIIIIFSTFRSFTVTLCQAPNNDVRITNTVEEGENIEGEVEIYYNDLWRPLCARGWGRSNADVICKTIGYYLGAVEIKRNDLFGQSKRRNYYYIFRGLSCMGTEYHVAECQNWNKNVIDLKICSEGIAITVCRNHNLTKSKLIRLANTIADVDSTSTQGEVEILYYKKWRPLCARMWSKSDANVVCKSVGFTKGAMDAKRNDLYGQIKKRDFYYVDFGLGCNGTESDVKNCTYWNTDVLDKKECAEGIAIAVCRNNTETEVVRLTSVVEDADSDSMQGEVEIFYNDKWRPLCAREWRKLDADVVCKTIGFSKGALDAKINDLYGQNKKRNYYYIYMGFGCSGVEEDVRNCYYWNKDVMDVKTCREGIAIAVCKR